jgi:hypothetical protein
MDVTVAGVREHNFAQHGCHTRTTHRRLPHHECQILITVAAHEMVDQLGMKNGRERDAESMHWSPERKGSARGGATRERTAP